MKVKSDKPIVALTPELARVSVEMVIVLRSPLHIACTRTCSANSAFLRVENRPLDGSTSFPATGHQHYPLALALNQTETTSEEGGPRRQASTQVPIIPATLLRGRVRRRAAALVYEALGARKESLSLNAYHGLNCGAVTGQPASERLTLDESEQAGSHPFIGLLGGGPRMVRSTLVSETAWPINEATLAAGVVPSHVAEHATELRGHTRAMFFRRIDDLLEFADKLAPEVIANYPQEVRDWMEKIGANAEARRADRAKSKQVKKAEGGEDTKKVALQGFSAIEAVMPGVRYYLRFGADCTRLGYAGLGLLLLTLQNIAREQGLGGWTRNGYGQFGIANAVLTVNGAPTPLFADRIEGSAIELNMENPIIAQALDGWAKYATQRLSAKEIEHLMRVGGAIEEEE